MFLMEKMVLLDFIRRKLPFHVESFTFTTAHGKYTNALWPLQ